MNTAAPRPRVLLIEDDAAIRRFVLMALDELDVELDSAATLAEAEAALAARRPALLITDLMLPDGNGATLLERLATQSDAPARIVFSAGVDAALRQRLAALGVRCIVDKPASLAALLAAVSEGLALPVAAAPLAQEGHAIALHFGGDAGLYAAYRAATLEQFGADIVEGDRAAAAGDLAALRRVGHSLKTVLGLLGDRAGAELGRALEQAAHAAETNAVAHWPALRARLAAWRDAPAAG